MMRWLSLLRAFLIIDPLIIVATACYGSFNLLVALWDQEGTTQLRVARAWGRMLLRIAGVRVTVEGLENLQSGESYVFVSNHVSYMDTPVVLSYVPANFRFMAKSGLFQVPFIGGHLTKAGHIAVDLDNPRAALRVLTSAGVMIKKRGLSLLVFPEGGRTEDGELQPFKEGAAYLAIKGGVAVAPMAIVGIRDVLPMHSAHVRPGRVRLRIGRPIDVSQMTVRDRDALTSRLYEEVAALRNSC
jgi:1-acyl-sn-glycerol-3-phosphate acyltransferase